MHHNIWPAREGNFPPVQTSNHKVKKWVASWEKVPDGLSLCHTKKKNGRAYDTEGMTSTFSDRYKKVGVVPKGRWARCHPSLCKTKTQHFRALFAWCRPNHEVTKLKCTFCGMWSGLGCDGYTRHITQSDHSLTMFQTHPLVDSFSKVKRLPIGEFLFERDRLAEWWFTFKK